MNYSGTQYFLNALSTALSPTTSSLTKDVKFLSLITNILYSFSYVFDSI